MEWKTSNLFGVQWKWTTTSIFPFIYSETVIYLETKTRQDLNENIYYGKKNGQQQEHIYCGHLKNTEAKRKSTQDKKCEINQVYQLICLFYICCAIVIRIYN